MARSAALFSFLSLLTLKGVVSHPHERAPNSAKDVIIQMFQWNWDSVAAECTEFIGPAGYGFVQVSPAQEHIQGPQWWTDYQPVSYKLTSKRGDQAQYQNMIDTCHAAGVKVIADTIFNHMAGISGGTGVAGSSFTQFNYPGIYTSSDFHYCGLEPNNVIVNYDNEVEVWTCELEGLADLYTEMDAVRETLAAYGNDLISLGVDGLRLDAAKNINATDLANIASRLNDSPYLTQEVIWGSGQPVTPELYTGIGDVMEFRYTSALQSAFLGGGISTLENLSGEGWIASDVANVFVADHDTERGGDSLNVNSASNTYVLAHIFSLSYPFGTPTVLSSYAGFQNTDVGAPNGDAGTCSGNEGTNGWYCQHRWTAIAGMVGFHNQVGTAALVNWVSPQSEQIAFGRGSSGFVAINNADSAWSATLTTSLVAGTYCDVVGGSVAVGICTGKSFTVSSSGTFTATIPARSAIAIHTGAKGSGSGTSVVSSVSVLFQEDATTFYGENIYLSGSTPELGSWNTSIAVPLSAATYPIWATTVSFAPGTSFQYKFIREEPNGTIEWETGSNRQFTVPIGASTASIPQTSWA